MPRNTLNSGDSRFDAAGNELILVHNYATTTPRQSLWSVVDHTNELRIVDFGPKGSKHRRSRKDGVVGRGVKRSSGAEWQELLRRSRAMSAAGPADVVVQAVRETDLVEEVGSEAASDAGDAGDLAAAPSVHLPEPSAPPQGGASLRPSLAAAGAASCR